MDSVTIFKTFITKISMILNDLQVTSETKPVKVICVTLPRKIHKSML